MPAFLIAVMLIALLMAHPALSLLAAGALWLLVLASEGQETY